MKRFFVLLLGCLLGVSPAAAETVTLEQVVGALEGPFQAQASAAVAIHDFAAGVSQRSTIQSLDRIQRAEGRVQVRFEGQTGEASARVLFRWEYTEPTAQEFVSDGVSLFAYVPENRQVIQSDVQTQSAVGSDNPIAFLTGLGHLSRDFQVAWAEPQEDAEGNFILELSPRRPSPLLERLVVVVNRDAVVPAASQVASGSSFPLRSTTILDPNGNTTVIEFRDVQVNSGIPDAVFHFDVPAGVQVIRPDAADLGG
ncbi:MAG: outer membrane lipoprotein carrier protein LolA [Desulfuromonadaceae bacterium]